MEKQMSDDQIKEILKNSKTIAMIGVSSEKKGEDPKNLKRKPANVVMKYMQDFGYKVIPVNPFAKGEVINGETVIESLDDISEKIDIVDVFRPSKETPGFAKEAAKLGAKTLWLQYGIQNEEAKKISEEANIKYIASSSGLTSTIMAKKHFIANSTSDYHEILKDEEVDLVIVTTQHHMHAKMVIEAINSGKSVFVEKPLALNESELDEIIKSYNSKDVNISVGFNRRFAPLAKKMKEVLKDIQSGKFTKQWMEEHKSGQKNFLKMRKQLADHPIEKVGKQLRAMMPWIGKNKLVDKDKN